MIVVNRFRIEPGDAEAFRVDIEQSLAVLAQQKGHVSGRIGRNVDDPSLWVLTTEWDSIGSYRRALSTYDVKLTAVPTLSRGLDEPSAYEAVLPGEPLNISQTRWLG